MRRLFDRRRDAASRLASNLFAILLLLIGPTPLALVFSGPRAWADDLPPPPGALEHELSLGPTIPLAVVPEGALSLSHPIDIPFVLEGGHIIIEASVDGNPPKPFMFDTGATNLITPDIARTLKVSPVRTERVGGIGPAVSRAETIKVGRIAFGAALLDQPIVKVIDIRNTILDRGSRPRLAGLIGAELLARYTVTIDYQRRILTLHNPGFRPQAAAFSLPLGLSISNDGLTHPSISAELDGVAGDFTLDTGSGGQLFLSGNFEREHNPFAQYGKVLSFISAGGIGGHANVQMAFGRQLRFGTAALSPPVVSGPTDTSSGRLHGAGLIGAGILGLFVVTIDYQSAHAYFEPVAKRTLPTVLRGTGMIFDKPDHEAFEVLDILKGSAAERAGLHRGDRIVEAAGHPARDLSVSDLGSLNSAPASGTLTIRTSDQRRFDLAIGQILP